MPEGLLTAQQKELVAERAKFCCEYCLSQVAYSPDPFSVDHIVPRVLGRSDELYNLAYACLGCNGRKFTSHVAIDPVTGQQVELYHPRHHRWSDHFMWNDDFSLIQGLTPTGRATVMRLQLNRAGVVNLRRLLRTINRHPPTS